MSELYFRQLRLPDIGCASYLIGGEGSCAVVDPRWDAVRSYLGLARSAGLSITHIIETHVHADHVSGATRLAERTGATIYLHRAAQAYYPHQDLDDGDVLTVGAARLTVLHTPGHSADSISLLLVPDGPDEPVRLLTGDTLFSGDVGRPDLHGTEGALLAADLFDSLHGRLLSLDDEVVVYPGHLAGSLCGKNIAPDPSTTIGKERRANRALAIGDRASFIADILADLPPRPPNLPRIVELNRGGAPSRRPGTRQLDPGDVLTLPAEVAIVDGRDYPHFSAGHLPGALNVPIGYGQFGLMVSWLVDPGSPLLIIAADDEDLADALDSLVVLGMTEPVLTLSADPPAWRAAGLQLVELPTVRPNELQSLLASGEVGTILDVREPREAASGVIPGTVVVPYRQLDGAGDRGLVEPVVTVCNSGNRSALGASLLLRRGRRVVNLAGGTTAWADAGLPLVTS